MGQRLALQQILEALPGVDHVYYQPPTTMEYPCIKYELSSNRVNFADNIKYALKKGYTVIVIDRNPDSLIPDQVEGLPLSRFERKYVADGLHHFAFQLFF